MSNFAEKHPELIREYARITVQIGINVQKGQDVVIACPVEHYEFARLVAKEAYAAGAGEVIMQWRDDPITKEFFLHASDESISTIPDYRAEMVNYHVRRKCGRIAIIGDDPEGMTGIDFKRMTTYRKAMNEKTLESTKAMMASEIPWTVVSVPQKDWAHKVFPDMPVEEAMDCLWEKILSSVRVTEGKNAVEEWSKHDENLKSHCDALNLAQYSRLHYVNGIGTDFTVGLVKDHIWCGGSEKAGTGIIFQANMPTEEIFTMPDSRVAEGTLVASRPLSYQGTLIDGFSLTFHEGKVVEYHAEKGEDALKALLDMGENAKRLGEVAIVPYSSPISQLNMLFYETLFDENAACHFALGECYPTTIKGGENYSDEEMAAHGGNIFHEQHEDFMVGTPDLTITGIKDDGSETVIFKNGEWV